MSNSIYDQCLIKHGCPTTSKMIFQSTLILLLCLLGGIAYGFTIMDVPQGLNPENLRKWQLGFGFGWGVVAAVVLLLVYFIWFFRKFSKVRRCVASNGSQ